MLAGFWKSVSFGFLSLFNFLTLYSFSLSVLLSRPFHTGKATLVIPSDLAYGDGGSGQVIPPGATLKFDIELFKVLPPDERSRMPPEGETEVIELPDGTKLRVPKGVKARMVDNPED